MPAMACGFDSRHRHHVGAKCAAFRFRQQPKADAENCTPLPCPSFQNRNRFAGLRFCVLRWLCPAASVPLRLFFLSKSQPRCWVAILFFGGQGSLRSLAPFVKKLTPRRDWPSGRLFFILCGCGGSPARFCSTRGSGGGRRGWRRRGGSRRRPGRLRPR